MKIKVDLFDPASVDKAISDLEEYAMLMEAACSVVVSELADLGAQTAQQVFDSAQVAQDTRDIAVVAQKKGLKSAEVVAMGQGVGFIEFGAGVGMGQGPTLERPPGWGLGEYGQGKGANPPWVYKGSEMPWNPPGTTQLTRKNKDGTRSAREGYVMTHGNPPAHGMLDALEDMYDAAPALMRKELGKL